MSETNIHPLTEDDQNPLDMPGEPLSNKNGDGFKLNAFIFRPILIVSDSIHRETYTYDDNGYETLYLSQDLSNGIWENVYRTTITYADNGRVRKAFSEQWQNGTLTSTSSITDTLDSKWNMLASWIIIGQLQTRFVYTYTADNKVLTMLRQEFQNNLLVSAYRSTYTYLDGGKVLNLLGEQWKDNTWTNMDRSTITYDSRGNRLTDITEKWENGAWVTAHKYTNTYDENNNRLTYVSESWTNGAMTQSSRQTWTFDNNGNNLSFTQENWANGMWVNTNRTTYTYDSNNNRTSYIKETWGNGSWINSSKIIYTYENKDMITDIAQNWVNDAWLNTFKHVYKYDNYGNAVKGESFKWVAEGSVWTPGASQMQLRYDGGKGFWLRNNSIVEMQYVQVTGVANKSASVNDFNLLQNYPNPFNPATTISYSIPKSSSVELKVFDMLGKEISTLVKEYQPAGSHSVQFNASSFPSGMYIYEIRANNFIKSGKMLLLK